MDKKIVLKLFPNKMWSVALVEIYNDNVLNKTININKFYEVNDDYIIIYDTIGGSGTGFTKGDVLHKIKIDCDFETLRDKLNETTT